MCCCYTLASTTPLYVCVFVCYAAIFIYLLAELFMSVVWANRVWSTFLWSAQLVATAFSTRKYINRWQLLRFLIFFIKMGFGSVNAPIRIHYVPHSLNFPVNSVNGTSFAVRFVESHYENRSLSFDFPFQWNEPWQFCQIYTSQTLRVIITRVAVDAAHFSFKLCTFWFTQKVITVQLTLSMQSITSTYPNPVDAIRHIAISPTHTWFT